MDPLRLLYRFYSLINRWAQILLSPFRLIGSLINSVPKFFRRRVRVPTQVVGNWAVFGKMGRWFNWLTSRPAKLLAAVTNSSIARRSQKTYFFRAIQRGFAYFVKASLLMTHWLVQCAGFLFQWSKSRKWVATSLFALPSMLLVTTSLLTSWGARIGRNELAQWYLDLSQVERNDWEKTFHETANFNPEELSGVVAGGEQSSTDKMPFSLDDEEWSEGQPAEKLSSYTQLLFRRIRLLKGQSDHGYYAVGLALFQRGADAEAKAVLRKAAPDNEVRYVPAHGVMSCILMKEMARKTDPSLLAQFQHHATAARQWGNLPIDVRAASAELHWVSGDQDTALQILAYMSEVQPEFFLYYYERATQAGLGPLADTVRLRGIHRCQGILADDPRNVPIRVCLAALECTKPEGLAAAEKLLQEGKSIEPSPLLSRALSEVYLKQFDQGVNDSSSKANVIAMLDKAMAVDPSNPSVAEKAERWMSDAERDEDMNAIGDELNRILVAGSATTGTHALLAEFYLKKNQLELATTHLEQVYRIAPTAAKYSNRLAHNYAVEGRLKDALAVCNRSLALIVKRQLMNERHVDDLLDTFGKVRQKLEEYDEATRMYEWCLSLNPQRPDTRLRLAKLHRFLGNEMAAAEQERLAKTVARTAEKQQAFLEALAEPTRFLKPSVAAFKQPVGLAPDAPISVQGSTGADPSSLNGPADKEDTVETPQL